MKIIISKRLLKVTPALISILILWSFASLPAATPANESDIVTYECSNLPADYGLYSLFALPATGELGTLHYAKSLSIISLKPKCPAPRILKSKYLSSVSGGNLYFLPPGKKTLAYIQTRRVVVFKFTSDAKPRVKKLEIYRPTKSITESLEWGRIIDEEKGLYLFGVQSLDYAHEPVFLRLYRLKNGRAEYIRSWGIGSNNHWGVNKETILVYMATKTEESFTCRTLTLEETSHPLCEYYNGKRAGPKRPGALYVHPYHPFALVTEHSADGRGKTTLLEWRDNVVKEVAGIFVDEQGQFVPDDLIFSPDGKKMIMVSSRYKKHNMSGAIIAQKEGAHFVAFTIDDKNELFIDDPEKLGYFRHYQAYTWNANSTSFAVSYTKKDSDKQYLRWWNL